MSTYKPHNEKHLFLGSPYHYATVGLDTFKNLHKLGFETVVVLEESSRSPVFYVMQLSNNFTTASYDKFYCRVWVDSRAQTAGAIITEPIVLYELVPVYDSSRTYWERTYLSLVVDNYTDKKLSPVLTYHILKYYQDKLKYGYDKDKYPWLEAWRNTLAYYINVTMPSTEGKQTMM